MITYSLLYLIFIELQHFIITAKLENPELENQDDNYSWCQLLNVIRCRMTLMKRMMCLVADHFIFTINQHTVYYMALDKLVNTIITVCVCVCVLLLLYVVCLHLSVCISLFMVSVMWSGLPTHVMECTNTTNVVAK